MIAFIASPLWTSVEELALGLPNSAQLNKVTMRPAIGGLSAGAWMEGPAFFVAGRDLEKRDWTRETMK